MPLFRRKPFPLLRFHEENVVDNEEAVLQIRFTGEIFQDYGEYVERINFYRQRVWSCRATGRTGLTYEEAQTSEQRAWQGITPFSHELYLPALQIIHFSTKRLDALGDELYHYFKDRYAPGEEVQLQLSDHTYMVKVVEPIFGHEKKEIPNQNHEKPYSSLIASDASMLNIQEDSMKAFPPSIPNTVDKTPMPPSLQAQLPYASHYRVRFLDGHLPVSIQNEQNEDSMATESNLSNGTSLSNLFKGPDPFMDVPVQQLSRKRTVFSKEQMRRFIREVAVRASPQTGAPWIARRELVDQYKLLRDLPDPLVEKYDRFVKEWLHMKPEMDGKQKNEEVKKKKGGKRRRPSSLENKENINRTNLHRKDGMKKRRTNTSQVVFPTDEERLFQLFPGLIGEPAPTDHVVPMTDFPVTNSHLYVGAYLVSWNFLQCFGRFLHLYPFTLDDFEQAIKHNWTSHGPCPLLAESHAALLGIVWDAEKQKGHHGIALAPRTSNLATNPGHLEPFSLDSHSSASIGSTSLTTSSFHSSNGSSSMWTQFPRTVDGVLRELREDATTSWFTALTLYVHRWYHLHSAELGVDLPEELVWMPRLLALDYHALTVDERSLVLNWLIHIVLDTDHFREYLDDCAEELIELAREQRRLRELIRKQPLPEGTDHTYVKSMSTPLTGIPDQNDLTDGDASLSKKLEQVNREYMKQSVLRLPPLGHDRRFYRYWFFDIHRSNSTILDYGTGRIMVEYVNHVPDVKHEQSTLYPAWGYYDETQNMNALVASLNSLGLRESRLKMALKDEHDRIAQSMCKRVDETTRRVALNSEDIRRSARLKTAARMQPYLTYVNKWKVRE